MAGFAGLSSTSKINVLLELIGGPKYKLMMGEATVATERFAAAQRAAAIASTQMTKRTFLQNQVLFTGRRMLFYATLGTLALSAAVVKLGLDYFNAMQQTRVALGQVITDNAKLERVLHGLFLMAAQTPFQIKDIATQFKALYIPLSKFGYSADYVQKLMLGMMNSLAVVGKLSGSALQRASVQMIHMVAIGRPMGQVLQALARDNIPIYQALHKYLGLTEEQLRSTAGAGVTVRQVLDAVQRYMLKEPGYMNQALLSQTKTLAGAWSTFKDFLSQASATGGAGLFTSIQGALQGVDIELTKLSKTGKTLNMMDVITAIDKQLSPRTHAVTNLFVTFNAAVKTTVTILWLLFKVVTVLLIPFDVLAGLFGANNVAAKWLGFTIGILTAAFIAEKIAVMASSFATEINIIRKWAMVSVDRVLAFWTDVNTLSQEGYTVATRAGSAAESIYIMWMYRSVAAQRLRALWTGIVELALYSAVVAELFLTGALTGFSISAALATAATWALTVATTAFSAALWSTGIPEIIVGVALLTAGLVVLYFKWKRFHDIVQGTVQWFRENWKWARFLLIVLGPIGQTIFVITALMDAFRGLAGWIKAAYQNLKDMMGLLKDPTSTAGWKGLFKLVTRPFRGMIDPATMVPGFQKYSWTDKLLKRAGGGFISQTQYALVGERGPEIARFPGGTRIFNQSQAAQVGGGVMPPIIVKVYPQDIRIDSQKIGEVVSKATTDKEARL